MCSLFKKPLFEVVSDTPYLPGSTSDAHKFDTYLPLGVTGPVPVVLHVHGGGWVRGGRKSWAYGAVPVCSSLASKRMVCFSVGYRLGTPHPHAICDVAAAVAFILAFAAEQHGGDLSRVYLSGHSAGAHLIALLYSDPQYLQYGRILHANEIKFHANPPFPFFSCAEKHVIIWAYLRSQWIQASKG